MVNNINIRRKLLGLFGIISVIKIMINNMKIRNKLLGSFGIVSVIMLIIALVSFVSLGNVNYFLDDFQNNHLPGFLSISAISNAQAGIDAAEKALINPRLSDQERKEQHQKLKESWARADAARQGYESLRHSKEESEIWTKFVNVWDSWRIEHEKLMKMINDWEKNKVDYILINATHQALDLNTTTSGLAIDMLDKLIEMNNTIVKNSKDEADTVEQRSNILLLITIVIGFALSIGFGIIISGSINKPLKEIIQTSKRIAAGETELQADTNGPVEIATLANAFNSMTSQLSNKAEEFKKASEESNKLSQDFKQASEEAKRTNEILKEVIAKAKEIIVNLNSSSKEIEAAAQEQTSGASEQASGVTEVSATLEELTITAKQITKNVGELVFSSEEVIKLLEESEERLLHIVSQLKEVGRISTNNTSEISELGKRSVIINEMVELIKEVANKTDMLSINASIEAARSGEAGTGFSVVASEIRELSRETINSAKSVEKAAKEIQDFIKSIIVSSETESKKVLESGKVVSSIYDNMQSIGSKINNNYSFTQKIDVSIKQQESGSRQAADTMKQMSEISRQSAETARQTSLAVKDIVNFSTELDDIVKKVTLE